MNADPRLARRSATAQPALVLWNEIALPLSRAHEICGQARRMLALQIAAAALGASSGPVVGPVVGPVIGPVVGPVVGPVFWIAPAWGTDPLNPDGVAAILPPQALVFVRPTRGEDLLWATEEVLRSGAAPVVVADLPEPPGMTPVRRLHLAAEAGAQEGFHRPLGLLLTPGDGGAPGIETRHRAEPRHSPGRTRWRIDRLRARMAPPQGWLLEQGVLTRDRTEIDPAPDLGQEGADPHRKG